MSGLLFFISGAVFGVILICCLQINRKREREHREDEKEKCADTFPSE